MKTTFTFFFAALLLVTNLTAQTTYTITKSENWDNKSTYPNPCFKCTFDLATNVVLTIERDVTFSDVVFNGGTVVVDKKDLTLWTNGGKNQFNSTKLIFNGNGQLMGNGPVVLNNAAFTFNDKSTFTSNHSLEMISSKLTLNENSSFIGQGSKVSLLNSHMVAGDGLSSSKAFIKMNGAKLILEDKNSGIEALNANNYYFNWSAYTSTVLNQAISTINSTINCGSSAANSCSAPVVYGPIALTYTGFGSPIILPVIIADFSVVNTLNSVNLAWSTKQESNSAFFIIERSNDGSSWSQLAKITASGNSANMVRYNYADLTKVNSVAHYRLKMIDLDGRFVYSDVKSIRFTSIASVKVFPNPATDYVTVTPGAKALTTKIRLINQNGQVVAETQTNGNNAVTISLKHQAAGAYAITVADEKGARQVTKLVVQ